VFLLIVVAPVVTVEKPNVLFGFSKQRWKNHQQKVAAGHLCRFFHCCGSFHRRPLPRFFLFASFSFLVEKISSQDRL